MIDFEEPFAKDYLSDCSEHLETMETILMAIEKRAAQFEGGAMDSVLRGVRYIKGGATAFELVKVRELAHHTEAVLSDILANRLLATPELVRVLLGATDRLRDLLQDLGASNQADISDIASVLVNSHAGQVNIPAMSRAPETAPTESAKRLRIILAEDDITSRFLLHTFLSRFGQCHVAVNGREAVAEFRTSLENGEPYDLICLDIMMPELDGREAARQIRDLENAGGHTPGNSVTIIMTTAVNETTEIIRCLREFSDGYLVKPIDLGALLRLMKSYQLVQESFVPLAPAVTGV